MSAVAGRLCRIKYHSGGSGSAGVVVAYALGDEIKGTAESIDISNKDSHPHATKLDDIGMKSTQLVWNGYLAAAPQHRTLIDLFEDAGPGAALHWFSYEAPGVGVWAGDFFITDFSVKGDSGASAGTFNMTLDSSGAVTFTAAT